MYKNMHKPNNSPPASKDLLKTENPQIFLS